MRFEAIRGVLVFWAAALLGSLLTRCNKRCTFLHHNPVSVDWLILRAGQWTQIWFGNRNTRITTGRSKQASLTKISCCLPPATEWFPFECHLTEIATDEWSDSQNPTLLTTEGKNNLINANLKSDLAGESQKAQSLSTPLTRRSRKGELWAYGFNIGMRFTFGLYTSLGSVDRTQVESLGKPLWVDYLHCCFLLSVFLGDLIQPCCCCPPCPFQGWLGWSYSLWRWNCIGGVSLSSSASALTFCRWKLRTPWCLLSALLTASSNFVVLFSALGKTSVAKNWGQCSLETAQLRWDSNPAKTQIGIWTHGLGLESTVFFFFFNYVLFFGCTGSSLLHAGFR